MQALGAPEFCTVQLSEQFAGLGSGTPYPKLLLQPTKKPD